MKIGSRLKSLRTLCGLTQEELADRCELTKGYISQIENDLTSPSISTLTDLLDTLGSNLPDFFSDFTADEKIVFSQDDYVTKDEGVSRTTWLVPNSQKNEMEPILFELRGEAEATIDMPHEGQEFGYVMEGQIQVIYGNKRFICKKGETFYFTTNKPHTLKNMTKKDAKIIWVSSPPNF